MGLFVNGMDLGRKFQDCRIKHLKGTGSSHMIL